MNSFYTPFVEWILDKLTGNTVKALLLDTSVYTFDVAHQFLDSVPAGARIGAAVTVTGKSVTGGAFNASSPFTFATPPDGEEVGAYMLYIDTGVEATSRLIAYIDTGYNLSELQTNGNDVNIQLDPGPDKIFVIPTS